MNISSLNLPSTHAQHIDSNPEWDVPKNLRELNSSLSDSSNTFNKSWTNSEKQLNLLVNQLNSICGKSDVLPSDPVALKFSNIFGDTSTQKLDEILKACIETVKACIEDIKIIKQFIKKFIQYLKYLIAIFQGGIPVDKKTMEDYQFNKE